jgi:hypothetical protein
LVHDDLNARIGKSTPAAEPLLRLLVAADNAGMESELSKADPPKCRRRWFQSACTPLFFTLTLRSAAGWLGKDGAETPERAAWWRS